MKTIALGGRQISEWFHLVVLPNDDVTLNEPREFLVKLRQ